MHLRSLIIIEFSRTSEISFLNDIFPIVHVEGEYDPMHPVLLFAGFFIISMAHNLLGPLIPNIMGSTDMTLADSGLLMSFQQIGSVIAIILSLSFFKHKKQPSVLKIGYLFFILSLGAVVLISGKALLYLLYIVIGFGIFLIDSSSNAIISMNILKSEPRIFLCSIFSSAWEQSQQDISSCPSKVRNGDGLTA